MSPASEPEPETCYDCGREVAGGTRQVLVCLWKSPAAGGAEHWGEAGVCPACARRRDRRRLAWLSALFLTVALLTGAVACQFLP